MNKSSRTRNFSRNAGFSALSSLISTILTFIRRVVFVHCLSAVYLGLGGLFSNVLIILSLAELGIGSAISYSLYRPLANDDKEEIKSLIGYYKKVYRIIGLSVILLGLLISPFLNVFIKEKPDIEITEFYSIYLLIVANTAASYFFSYKYSIFNADQKSYVIQKTYLWMSILQSVAQIGILVSLRQYIAYLLVGIVSAILTNIILTRKANEAYPYLKEHYEPLGNDTVTVIKKNTFALFLYKVGIAIATTIDTLLISKFFGIFYVAIYANYHLIISYSDNFFNKVLGTIIPSMGNLLATEGNDKNIRVFHAVQLLYYWLSTYIAVILIVIFNPIVLLAFGKSYLFNQSMVIAIVASITITNFQRPCSLVRDAAGLFWYGKYRPLVMSVLNIAFSLLFIQMWGVIGVVIGTALAKFSTYVWYDPYIVFKHALKDSLKVYFYKYAAHWSLLIILAITCYYCADYISGNSFVKIVVGILLSTLLVNTSFYFIYRNSQSFAYLKQAISPILLKLRHA